VIIHVRLKVYQANRILRKCASLICQPVSMTTWLS